MAFTGVYSSFFSFLSTVTRRRHDVFLSFRGEDIRHNITAQLHTALEEAGIPTLKDDVNLEIGGEIGSELLKAIQMSWIAIIVFSGNYANSGWCLDELVKIVECKNQAGQLLLPVFYDVDPSDVGQQTGSFAEAFTMHEERFRGGNLAENKLEKWGAALTEAAALVLCLKDGICRMLPAVKFGRDQSKFIEEIVKHIMGRHQDAHMSASIVPPRMDSGICGMDKTLIAKAVYNQNFLRFEGNSFLSNVSTSAEEPDGLVALQKQFLSDILMEGNLNIEIVERATAMIKKELGSKRILAVLDNVNKLDQLNALAQQRDWFGSRSRIIITTKDAQLLNVLEVNDVYGDEGIQVIGNKYRQNLQTIEDLRQLIRRSHAQAYEAKMSLIAEIERERSKSATKAQIIAELQQSVDQTLPSTSLTSITNVIIHGMEGQGCGDDEIVGDFAGEEGGNDQHASPYCIPRFCEGRDRKAVSRIRHQYCMLSMAVWVWTPPTKWGVGYMFHFHYVYSCSC